VYSVIRKFLDCSEHSSHTGVKAVSTRPARVDVKLSMWLDTYPTVALNIYACCTFHERMPNVGHSRSGIALLHDSLIHGWKSDRRS
jgi:hypothetical protein